MKRLAIARAVRDDEVERRLALDGVVSSREALECELAEVVQHRQFGRAAELQQRLDELDAASAVSIITMLLARGQLVAH
jgi:hypothetical protein